jgi:Rhodopirellula transposase DDE domain
MIRSVQARAARTRYSQMAPVLDEQSRRRFVALEAQALGRGGVSLMARISGLARSTIQRGLEDVRARTAAPVGRIRRAGGGRKKKEVQDPGVVSDLKGLVEPVTRGDPTQSLLWTCRSLRNLSKELADMGHEVCPTVVGNLLHRLGYSLQANRKTREGSQHIDRDAQFRYINRQAVDFLAANEPVISVDTKKKELVGTFKNSGREWQPKGSPELVNVHDFIDPKLRRAVPYGVYDLTNNVGWVTVGTDRDTATFAVNTIRRWWRIMGRKRYPKAKRLMITADGGGSNGYRVRLWKVELQKLADELKLAITVCHLPPGTSKWNKIEHRLFSFITMNWRGKPLRSYRTIVQLIAATTTETGLTVRAELDERKYPKAVKVTDEQMATINLSRHSFHGDWNYTISPRRKAARRQTAIG